ncbi:MAG: WG repeat-containing protein, partial [Clostridiales bacterium]|nr:WG repeat-containing protein [Clostridiales bacterium]
MKSRTASKNILRIASAMVLLAVLSSCSVNSFRAPEKSEGTSTVGTSTVDAFVTETSEPAPTPIPTYAPGTELYGMLSVTGEVVVEPKYEYLDLFSEEGLARFEDHGLWGFLNAHGEELIPAQYEDANNFSEGLAAVKVDGRYGFIDMTGEMVIEPQYEGVEDGFRYGRCVITLNDLLGLIDLDGKVIVEPKYSSIAFPCRDYIMVMEGEDRYGVIDRDGNVVLDLQNRAVGNVDENGYIFFLVDKSDNEC